MKEQILGVILAGGKSRRFGAPKAFAKINDQPFYTYSLQAIQPLTNSQVVVTSVALKDWFIKENMNAAILTDYQRFAGEGPLAGLYTAMEWKQADWYVTVPIDVPYIESWVFEVLLDYTKIQTQAIIPTASRMHPLIAVYHHSVKKKLEENLGKGKRSVRELLERIEVTYVPIEDDQPFININSQIDFNNLLD